MNMRGKQMTFRDLLARFPDEDSCKVFLEIEALARWRYQMPALQSEGL